MEDVKFCLVFPREALSVPIMRHVLGDTLLGLGADTAAVADLLLAVTEACTNVLQHGGPGRRYEVIASLSAGGCLVEVVNTGKVFDPLSVPGTRPRWPLWPPTVPAVVRIRRRSAGPVTPERGNRRAERAGRPARPGRAWRHERPGRKTREEALAALPESGRGLAIMAACVDDVTLSSAPESGTVVSLQKRIAWRNNAPLAHPSDGLRDVG